MTECWALTRHFAAMGAGSSTAQGFVQFALSQEAGNSAQKVPLASIAANLVSWHSKLWGNEITSHSQLLNTSKYMSSSFFDSNAWTDVCNSRCSRLSSSRSISYQTISDWCPKFGPMKPSFTLLMEVLRFGEFKLKSGRRSADLMGNRMAPAMAYEVLWHSLLVLLNLWHGTPMWLVSMKLSSGWLTSELKTIEVFKLAARSSSDDRRSSWLWSCTSPWRGREPLS